jgi:hypothetical protein
MLKFIIREVKVKMLEEWRLPGGIEALPRLSIHAPAL